MSCDRLVSMCCDNSFARSVRGFYKENNLLVFGVVGHFLSATVFFDMLEKLSGRSDTAWSPVRLLGPTLWLPFKTNSGKLMATQTLVHSIMYFVACYYLVQSRYRKNMKLMGPWTAMHCFFMVYQIVLIMENRDDYETWETMLAFFAFLLHLILMLAATNTGMHWTPSVEPRHSEADAPVRTELDPLDPHISDENPESSGHSAETVVVSDDRRFPPPPSYESAIRTPSHATGDSSLSLQPGNRGRGINWPWRWSVFRQAAAPAAAAVEDSATAGIEMLTLEHAATASAELRAYQATATAEMRALTAAAAAELRAYEAAAAAAAELEHSEHAVVAAALLQPSGGGEERPVRRTGWLHRLGWGRQAEARAAAEDPSAGGQQLQAVPEPTGPAQQPLLQSAN